jgi:OmpA-OmpF porin, OOP family
MKSSPRPDRIMFRGAHPTMLEKRIAALLLACVPLSAYCADEGFYAFGAAGKSSFNSLQSSLDGDLAAAGATGVVSKLDGGGAGGKLGAGYMLNENLGFELSYVDLGKGSYNATYNGGSASARLKTRGVNASLIASLPLNARFSVFAKFGYFDSHVIADINAGGPAAPATGTRSIDGWGPSFGGGAAFVLDGKWSLRGEVERYSRLRYEQNAGEGYANLMSLGLVYRFY